MREIKAVLDFWLDLGVDGFRLDAVPYLVEREGTTGENLGETHGVAHDPGTCRAPQSILRAAGRGQSGSGGHAAILRAWRRVPYGFPFPADAAPVHGRGTGGPPADHRYHGAHAAAAGRLPMGDLPAQPRRADAGDGD